MIVTKIVTFVNHEQTFLDWSFGQYDCKPLLPLVDVRPRHHLCGRRDGGQLRRRVSQRSENNAEVSSRMRHSPRPSRLIEGVRQLGLTIGRRLAKHHVHGNVANTAVAPWSCAMPSTQVSTEADATRTTTTSDLPPLTSEDIQSVVAPDRHGTALWLRT